MQLRRKFLLSLILLGLIISGVMFVAFESQRSDAIADAQAGADDRANQTASSLDQQLWENHRMLRVVADDPRLVAHESDEQRNALESVRALEGIGGVSVVDGDGRMVNIITDDGESPEAVIGQDFSDREYVSRALAGEEYVSDPIDAETGNQVVVLSVPIYDDGEIVGTLNAALYLDGAFFQSAVSGQVTADTSVSIAGGEAILFEGGERLDSTIGGTAIVPTTGWTVTVEQRESAVTGQILRLALVQLGSSIVLLAAVGGFGAWIYRNHIRQTDRLRTRLQRLEKRQYDHGVALTGSPEWIEISNAVDRLAATLARREQMLLVLNRLLRHNLRNKLTVVMGQADQCDCNDQEATNEIIETCEGLLALSDRARMTEKLLMRESSDHEDPIELVKLVERRVAVFEERYPDASVRLEAGDPVRVPVDPAFQSVLDELLTNVGEHAGPAPTVDITIQQYDTAVSITVEDDGPGIPVEEASIVRGDEPISHLNHSGGLGLWLVDWIVTQSGGDVEFRSDDGTTVVITLPATGSER